MLDDSPHRTILLDQICLYGDACRAGTDLVRQFMAAERSSPLNRNEIRGYDNTRNSSKSLQATSRDRIVNSDELPVVVTTTARSIDRQPPWLRAHASVAGACFATSALIAWLAPDMLSSDGRSLFIAE